MKHSFILNGPKLWQEDSLLQLQTYYRPAAQHDMDVCLHQGRCESQLSITITIALHWLKLCKQLTHWEP